jgi:hypothetical protein
MLRTLVEINNCYKLQALLSSTSLAEEWVASAIYSPHKFVLKFYKQDLFSAQAVESYRREAMRYFGLQREGLVKLIEAEYFEERLFVCSEYYGDDTLAVRVKKAGEPDLTLAGELAVSLAQSIGYLHANGLVYASLSPENVSVAAGPLSVGSVALRVPGDFSLITAGEAALRLGKSASCFAAPELREGGEPGPACDIYALGAMLAWLTTLVVPDAGQGKTAWLDAMRQKNLPAAFLTAASRALSDAPGQRHGSCEDFMADLEPWLATKRKKAPKPWAGDAVTPPPAIGEYTSRPLARLPEAVPHPEVIKYFQELSSEYLSATVGAKAAQEQLRTRAATARPDAAPAAMAAPGNGGPSAAPLPGPLTAGGGLSRDEKPARDERSGGLPRSLGPPRGEGIPLAREAQESPAGPVPEPKGQGEPPPATGAMNWRYRSMNMDGVLAALRSSVQRARGAKGNVRFIEEPDTAEALDQLDSLFASLSEAALYVDVGSMLRFGAADVTDFLRAYRQALARALRHESRRSLFRFGRLAERLGVRGLFGAYPLGALVYGEDGEETPAKEADYPAIIEAITVFGRRRRPLLLVVRGCECLQPALTDFFVRMVPVASVKPVCLFVFGEDFPEDLKAAARKSAG